ncbi:hypothetical protein BAXH7_00624 [Bacillus amyloliquefaciens XH7]|nr:hypothetical protein LL3_00680 [Bacillus amyloliquefaciens LL3]AEK87769.1 hypothetical protein BAXH7_00624 [Bacillus amyloliquefaciens XH7]KYC94141.1 hypothetical protein B425_0674 [Bacillus amyloliquefaciens]QBG55043.1 hypothetical protein D2M30_0692 [Bacillus amyloliquefaciens]
MKKLTGTAASIFQVKDSLPSFDHFQKKKKPAPEGRLSNSYQ